jgi:FkbM family methyltransferase
MVHPLKRLADDAIGTWSAMPKSQALRWYGAAIKHAPTILRERKLYAADREMHGILHFHLLGHEIDVDLDAINTTPGNGYAFLREFFVRRIYFREFKQLSFESCLDLGCNTGIVSGLLKSLAGPQGRVVGVDPSTHPDSVYRASVIATPGITLHQGVLCGESLRHDTAALHALCDPYNFDVKLAITIEELMSLYGFQHVDFVKMDIEGAEFDIFRDSVHWLDRVDNLAMEVHNAVGDPTQVIERLKQAGFRVKWLDDNGYPIEDTRQAGYIYASRIGSLKD